MDRPDDVSPQPRDDRIKLDIQRSGFPPAEAQLDPEA